MNIAVTTTRNPAPGDEHRAKHYAAALHAPFVSRQGASFAAAAERAAASTGQPCESLLVVTGRKVSIWGPEGMLTYHPGMALHRVAGLRRGEPDTMVEAMRLTPGDTVLDCTAGLAADAVVAACAVGPAGRVLALESIAPLALLLKVGLRHYPGQGSELTAAMRRVRVRHCRHEDHLAACPPGSFDIVYFDPMFAQPVAGSTSIAPLRPLADHTPLTQVTLAAAQRVARRYVVVKDRSDGPYVQGRQWDDISGGRRSRIVYCLLAGKAGE